MARVIGPLDHCMFDLETISTASNAAILSIGAVMFHPEIPGVFGGEFYVTVSLQSQIHYGSDKFLIDGDTFEWWMRQSDAARLALFTPKPIGVYEMLKLFTTYWEGTRARTLWANGASFDVAILKNAFRMTHMKQPFAYNHDRDTRTVFEFTGVWPQKDVVKPGVEHNALDDAKRQCHDLWEGYRAHPDVLALPPRTAVSWVDTERGMEQRIVPLTVMVEAPPVAKELLEWCYGCRGYHPPGAHFVVPPAPAPEAAYVETANGMYRKPEPVHDDCIGEECCRPAPPTIPNPAYGGSVLPVSQDVEDTLSRLQKPIPDDDEIPF